MIKQIIKFGLVGSIAMLVHWLFVVLLVSNEVEPLLANIYGFLIAFSFSYVGHNNWTFQSKTNSFACKQSFGRFFIVACSSFVINEFLYYILLSYTTLDYMTALAIVLITVSILTFILSSVWAFKRDL